MCLRYISKINKRVTNETVQVWKYFSFDGLGRLRYKYRSRGPRLKRGIWIKADNKTKIYADYFSKHGDIYRSGFHGFRNKAYNDSTFTSMYVLFRKVRTIGTDKSRKTLVADEMYIPTKNEKIVKGEIVKIKKKT